MIFLVVNISPKVVFGMLYLTFSNANIDFFDWKLRWKNYTTEKTLLITRYIKLVERKEFGTIVLDSEYETFVIYVISLHFISFNIQLFSRP